MNIQVDKLAGEFRKQMTANIPTMKIPAGAIAIGINGTRYHHFPAAVIRQHVHEKPLKEYIKSKNGWSEEGFQRIEWATYERVLKSLPASQQVNWIKLAHNWQNTGRQKMKFGENEATWQCPLQCGEQESAMHFCECKAELSIQHKTVHLNELTENLKSANTCPSLRRAIIEAISIHCNITVTDPFSPAFNSERAKSIKKAITDQTSIGINHLLKGRVMKDLFQPQLDHFERQPPSEEATPIMKWKGWRKKVIGFLVEFTLRIWNDRNSVVHGTPIQHSKLALTAHVHHLVRTEYHKFDNEQDTFMEDHFKKKVETRLQDNLKALRYWLKRVEASRARQSLIHEAQAKVRQLQEDNIYINIEDIIKKSNRDLSKWIHSKAVPPSDSQPTLDRFLRA